MVEYIKNILIREEGYSNRSAEITAVDLSNIKDQEIAQALSQWLRNREKTNVLRGEFSCAQLMRCYDMKYRRIRILAIPIKKYQCSGVLHIIASH